MEGSAVSKELELQPELCGVLAQPSAVQGDLWINLDSGPCPEAHVGVCVVPSRIVVAIDVSRCVHFIIAVSGRKHLAVLVVDPAEPSPRPRVDVLALDTGVEPKLEAGAGKYTPRQHCIVSALFGVPLIKREHSLAGGLRPVIVLGLRVSRSR